MEQFDDLFKLGNLISAYLADTLSKQQSRDLQKWLAASPDNQLLFEKLTAETKLKTDHTAYGGTDKKVAWANINSKTDFIKRSKRLSYILRYGVAASVLLCLSIGGYFLLHKQQPLQQVAQVQKLDVAPGGNKAVLILSNGMQINLASAKTGAIANDANAVINKAKDGTVSYQNNNVNSAEVVYNTIKTPAGGQWPITLPDGSKVILDASSSITYPTVFDSKERIVAVTGQAYFEVVHRANQKFRVTTKGQTIEDIGTQFNIKAYDDEPQVKTTLLEGSVKVFNTNHSLILKPGEQAAISQNTTDIKLQTDVDMKQVVAWKNGTFRFHETGLHELMRDLARWYNIEIIYKGEVKDEPYYGTIQRNMSLNQVLNILQLSDIHFKIGPKTAINAGTLTITP